MIQIHQSKNMAKYHLLISSSQPLCAQLRNSPITLRIKFRALPGPKGNLMRSTLISLEDHQLKRFNNHLVTKRRLSKREAAAGHK